MITRNHLICSILMVIAVALAGCGKSTRQSPPKQQVEDAVRTVLPAFLSLDSIELEPISTGPETAKVNFKAIVIPKEDLCQVDREVAGTPRVTLLKVVQAAGTKLSLYGSVEARRTVDLWTLESPQIQVGLNQFGMPRGAFGTQAYVTSTKDAAAALQQQATNAEAQRREEKAAQERRDLAQKAEEERQARAEKARQEREEKAKIALDEQRQKVAEQQRKDEEQKQKEEEAVKQKLLLATVPGTRYVGTIVRGERIQRIRLVFTEQKDSLTRAEASNPDHPQEKQTFTGQLIFNPKPEENGKEAYQIVMSPISGEGYVMGPGTTDFSWFYRHNEGSLKLMLTDTGLEGGARMTYSETFVIHLKRETGTGPVVTPPGVAAPKKPSAP